MCLWSLLRYSWSCAASWINSWELLLAWDCETGYKVSKLTWEHISARTRSCWYMFVRSERKGLTLSFSIKVVFRRWWSETSCTVSARCWKDIWVIMRVLVTRTVCCRFWHLLVVLGLVTEPFALGWRPNSSTRIPKRKWTLMQYLLTELLIERIVRFC